MEDKLVSISKFEDYIQADIAKQVLEDFGIKAVVTGTNASNVYSGLPFIEQPEVMVMSSRADEAKEILREHNEVRQPLAEDEEITEQ